MNNIQAADKLKKNNPRLMSMAIRAVRACEENGHTVSLQLNGKDKFRVVALVAGKPQENPELEKIVTPILAEKNWCKYEKGWIVAVKEEKPAVEPAKKKDETKDAK